jgi:hypothetical protein
MNDYMSRDVFNYQKITLVGKYMSCCWDCGSVVVPAICDLAMWYNGVKKYSLVFVYPGKKNIKLRVVGCSFMPPRLRDAASRVATLTWLCFCFSFLAAEAIASAADLM